jgi:hypothetical protein
MMSVRALREQSFRDGMMDYDQSAVDSLQTFFTRISPNSKLFKRWSVDHKHRFLYIASHLLSCMRRALYMYNIHQLTSSSIPTLSPQLLT